MNITLNGQRRLTTRNAHRRGTSLIEILVVLVILVLGILSIVKLFPAGFLALRTSENSAYADRLGQGLLESVKQNNGGLPDGIFVSYMDATGITQFDPNITPNDLGPYAAPGSNSPADPNNLYATDLNKARYISNETFAVPTARIVGSTSFPPLHVLNFGPVYLPTTLDLLTVADNTANAQTAAINATAFSVVSAPWNGSTGDSRFSDTSGTNPTSYVDNPYDLLSAGQPNYLIDYAAAKIAVPPTAYPNGQFFNVTVQVKQGLQTRTFTYQLLLPQQDKNGLTDAGGTALPDTAANYNGGWFSLVNDVNGYVKRVYETVNPGQSIMPTTVPVPTPAVGSTPAITWNNAVLVRPFRCMTNPQSTTFDGTSYGTLTTSFDTDPYEYGFCNPNIQANGSPTPGNLGVIAFNSLAAGKNGSPALKARVSYTAFDWHILHEDRDIPSTGSGTIRLTLGYLKQIGDIGFNQQTYAGLIPPDPNGAGDPTLNYDLLMLDTDTGQLLANTSHAALANTDANTTGSAATPISVSYKNGRIDFPDALGYGGKHLRLFYAGDADWALALQKAPSLYTRNYNAVTMVDDPNTIKVSQYAIASQSNPDDSTGVMINPLRPELTTVRVYFPIADEGKIVQLDGLIYPVKYKDGKTKLESLALTTFTVSEVTDARSGDQTAPKANVAFIDLPLPYYYPAGVVDPSKPNGYISIAALRGVSARAVVIWKERTNFKTRRVDTLLTGN